MELEEDFLNGEQWDQQQNEKNIFFFNVNIRIMAHHYMTTSSFCLAILMHWRDDSYLTWRIGRLSPVCQGNREPSLTECRDRKIPQISGVISYWRNSSVVLGPSQNFQQQSRHPGNPDLDRVEQLPYLDQMVASLACQSGSVWVLRNLTTIQHRKLWLLPSVGKDHIRQWTSIEWQTFQCPHQMHPGKRARSPDWIARKLHLSELEHDQWVHECSQVQESVPDPFRAWCTGYTERLGKRGRRESLEQWAVLQLGEGQIQTSSWGSWKRPPVEELSPSSESGLDWSFV